MAKAFSKLEEVDISQSGFEKHYQFSSLLNEMAKVDKPNLRKFGLGNIRKFSADSDLPKLICKIPEVNFFNNQFGYIYVSALFEKIAESEDLRLEVLDISGDQCNPGGNDEVDVDIMADAVLKLRKVKLLYLQVEEIEKVLMKIISADNMKLRHLVIDGKGNIDRDLLNSAKYKAKIEFNRFY